MATKRYHFRFPTDKGVTVPSCLYRSYLAAGSGSLTANVFRYFTILNPNPVRRGQIVKIRPVDGEQHRSK